MKVSTFTLCLVTLLAGCHHESGGAGDPKATVRSSAPVAVQRGPTVDELTAGMVEAATLGKSQTPVALKFDLLQKPVQGQPLEIALALLPGEAAGTATIDVVGTDGLPVPAGGSVLEFTSVEPAQVYRTSIKLIPAAEGVFLITLTVNLKHDQLADSRVFSVPVIVAANGPPASAGPSSSDTRPNPVPSPAS